MCARRSHRLCFWKRERGRESKHRSFVGITSTERVTPPPGETGLFFRRTGPRGGRMTERVKPRTKPPPLVPSRTPCLPFSRARKGKRSRTLNPAPMPPHHPPARGFPSRNRPSPIRPFNSPQPSQPSAQPSSPRNYATVPRSDRPHP